MRLLCRFLVITIVLTSLVHSHCLVEDCESRPDHHAEEPCAPCDAEFFCPAGGDFRNVDPPIAAAAPTLLEFAPSAEPRLLTRIETSEIASRLPIAPALPFLQTYLI